MSEEKKPRSLPSTSPRKKEEELNASNDQAIISSSEQKLEITEKSPIHVSDSTNFNDANIFHFENEEIQKAFMALQKEGRYAIHPEVFNDIYKDIYKHVHKTIVTDHSSNLNNTTNSTPPPIKDKIEEKDEAPMKRGGLSTGRGNRGPRGPLTPIKKYRETEENSSIITPKKLPRANTGGATLDMGEIMRLQKERKQRQKEAELNKSNSESLQEEKTYTQEIKTQKIVFNLSPSKSVSHSLDEKQTTTHYTSSTNGQSLEGLSVQERMKLMREKEASNNFQQGTPIKNNSASLNTPKRSTLQKLNETTAVEEVKKIIIEPSKPTNNTTLNLSSTENKGTVVSDQQNNNSTLQATISSRRALPTTPNKPASLQSNEIKVEESKKDNIPEETLQPQTVESPINTVIEKPITPESNSKGNSFTDIHSKLNTTLVQSKQSEKNSPRAIFENQPIVPITFQMAPTEESKTIAETIEKIYGAGKPVIVLFTSNWLRIEFSPALEKETNEFISNMWAKYSATVCVSDTGTTLFSIQNQGETSDQIESFVKKHGGDLEQLYNQANFKLPIKQEASDILNTTITQDNLLSTTAAQAGNLGLISQITTQQQNQQLEERQKQENASKEGTQEENPDDSCRIS